MDRETYSNPVIAKFINDNYLAVKFDGEGKDDVTYQGKTFKYVEFVQSNGRPGKYHELSSAILNSGKKPGERGGGFPTTAFFNADAQLIQTVPGYLSKERFEKILAYFNLPNFRETPWPDFEQNFKSAL